MQQIKLRECIRIAARPLDKTGVFAFAYRQVRLPLYPFSTSSNCHRNYKRTERQKRLKKIGKGVKNAFCARTRFERAQKRASRCVRLRRQKRGRQGYAPRVLRSRQAGWLHNRSGYGHRPHQIEERRPLGP